MTGPGAICGRRINADIRQVVFLTLALFLILISHISHAGTMPPPSDSRDDKLRISEIESYIRSEGAHSMLLLPREARQVLGWFSGWHQVHMSDDNQGPSDAESITDAPSSDDTLSFPLATSLHHKGFLPTHDAMMMGIGANKEFLKDKLILTARPFYGQSWRSLQGYWGGEVSLNVAHHPDDLPWGSLSMGYVDGNESLTDHGRGANLHGDIDLTNHFTLTAGIRQSSISGDTNYAMIKWGLSFGGNP